MDLFRSLAAVALLGTTVSGCALLVPTPHPPTAGARFAVMSHAQLWSPTDIRSMDLRGGPGGKGAFKPGEQVTCDYVDVKLSGHSPKFACRIGEGDEVKVKYGGQNGEVYGELIATRLLWALGFGADRMYQVEVICRGCPESLGGVALPNHERRFFPALIERKMDGHEWSPDGREGWAWNDLDVAPVDDGAPAAHRDALKLLAVLLQHTDSKREQQRILCLDADATKASTACARPFLMINDVGLTFGRANLRNRNRVGSVNLAAWRETPVWKGDQGCVGNLRRSFTGTLSNPVIGEPGRAFLASLLSQLTDDQLVDLFETARVDLRLRDPGAGAAEGGTVAEWVSVFKGKRQEVVARRCA
jgi:hypothetical protein